MEEVIGSIPIRSTKTPLKLIGQISIPRWVLSFLAPIGANSHIVLDECLIPLPAQVPSNKVGLLFRRTDCPTPHSSLRSFAPILVRRSNDLVELRPIAPGSPALSLEAWLFPEWR